MARYDFPDNRVSDGGRRKLRCPRPESIRFAANV
jgi:hypothetical protein